jgi:hypothetical protein
MRALLALAALLATLALPAASAAPLHVEQTSPTCGILANIYACLTVWAEADPAETGQCLVQDAFPGCASVSCTLSMPPSRCGTAGLAAGSHL